MRIGGIEKAVAGGSAAPERAAQAPNRALVPLAPSPRPSDASVHHLHVPFLAHLLAVKGEHAQTRERRRVAPSEAIAAYRATAGLARQR